MDATPNRRNSLFKLFHVFHVCLSIGLVIMFVRNQMMYEARFKKLEDDLESMTQISTTTDTEKQWAESIKTRPTMNEKKVVKRSVNNQTSKTAKQTNNQNVLDFKNSTKNFEDVTTCLDLLNNFLKKNKWSGRGPNKCQILRGPPGKPGRRGRRGPKGQAGYKGSIGKHGPPGPRGEKGFSGNVTVIGLKGDMGPKGTKGDKGNTGIKGQKGAQGPKGDFGGQKGEQGERGVKGKVGPRGCPGDSFAPPSFVSTPRYLAFRERDSALLVCNATANPYSRITWYRDKVTIPIQDSSDNHYEVKEVIFQSGSNESSCPVNPHPVTESSLVIKRSRSSDTGNYICEARNIMGVLRYKIRLLVQVYVKFTSVPSNITVTENQDVQLRCRASGVPSPMITWYRRDGSVMPSRYRIIQGDLHITKITKEQEGSYVCVASNVLGASSTETTVTVNVFPVITYFQDHQLTINETQTLTLPCNATGYPIPNITWNKTNGSFPRERYKFDSQMLNISNVQYEDSGEYVCKASNTVGTASKRAIVVVQVGPKIRRKPNDLENGYRGTEKVLHFEVFAFPEANITWKRLDNIKMNKRFRQEAANLVIDGVEYIDGGFYKATARNILGKVTVTTFLVVKDPVSPWITSSGGSSKITLDERSSFSRTCSAKGTPAPKLIWKFKNKAINSVLRHTNGSLTLRIANLASEHTGRYICEASNEFGSAREHLDLTGERS
ncbi:hemicentin-1-like isoform X2 [Actinia tenebrosa]|uniref:Hemicentin-1-like isoform X2 n=1 Tax=Actinia tenebrosa TaxID=6105 RepID=A0A6P8IFY7_ACTTE|nr:hemicentin-1-like isoform X2 [Actinia tenebrosa]